MKHLKLLTQTKKWFGKQEGVALVITLLITLILVLLGLSLLLQSSTDYLVSVNEQDATKALGYTEAGLDILNRLVRDYALQPTAPTDLTDLLNGPNNGSTGDDGLPDLTAYGIGLGRTLDTSRTAADFTTANEKTLAAMETINGKHYEVIRMGEDTNNDGNWDGNTRALIYLRIEDNYDPAGPNDNDFTDTDFNARAYVAADYPIFINADGTQAANQVAQQRGRARRMLLARLSPAGRDAIRTDGDLGIAGNLMVCGECGGVHANQTLTIGGAHTCAEATATQDLDVTNTGADIRGGAGVTQPVFIPEVNPYDDRFVPAATSAFWTLSNNVPWHAECGSYDPTSNPGASRYFAFVALPHNGNVDLRIYKAYWDLTNSHWIWRLIDDNLTGTLNLDAKLDNCGRLISSHISGITGPDTGATAGVNDGSNSEFYGFGVSNGSRYGTSCGTSGDDTLTVASRDGRIVNDWNNTHFNAFSETASPLFPQTGIADISDTPTLPGTRMNNSGDGTLDFNINNNITQNKAEWSMNGQVVWSPLYGAVIFVYGNVQLNGGSDYKYWNGSAIQTVSNALPDSRWRVSWIVFNTIDFSGNPAYAPVTDSFGATLVAGRDIELSGTGGGGPGNQDQCPSMNSLAIDCTTPPASTAAGFAGMVLAHEQINFTGNITMDGFVIAEDAAACSPTANNSSISTGSVQIHYDCNNPPDPWAGRSVRVNSWAEVQQ